MCGSRRNNQTYLYKCTINDTIHVTNWFIQILEEGNEKMGKIKKIVSIVLILALAVTMMPVNANAAVKLNTTKKTIDVGQSVTLKVTGTTQKVTWKSSNKKVATVTQKGKVTGKQEGKATISAKVGKKTLKCKITVKGTKGIRPEFKKSMDNFEACVNEVYDLCNEWMDNPTDMDLFSSFMEKALTMAEMAEEFRAWGESDLSLEEAVYCMEVGSRTGSKLIEIQEKLQNLM